MNKYLFSVLTVLIFIFMAAPVHAGNYRFSDAPPVTEAGDNKPSGVPAKTNFNFVEYSVSSSVRYPVVRAMDTRRTPRSRDVNSLDEVPASAWFTPRLGTKEMTPEEMVKGPEEKGAPQKPLTIIKAKTKGNSPGFIVKDSREIKYLIKFDQQDYPAMESGANFVVNRLFWSFGYNVPEDFVYKFSADDAVLGKNISKEDVDIVLSYSYEDEDGTYRAVASLFLEGEILGPISQRGRRKGDINDTIAHENRRVLRALRMFSAWLDNSGIRSDNSLDVYTGKPGQGRTVHYLVDFGENFGIHGLEKNRKWDGFEHFFSFRDTAAKFAFLGIPVQKWENFDFTFDDKFGTFESEAFDPAKWKETTQFMPIRSSQPDDDYWAAKIISSVQPRHLEALFKAAEYPDKSYGETILKILLKRREKVIQYAFSRVSPVEFVSLEGGKLTLKDMQGAGAEYRVRFLNSKGRKVSQKLTVPPGEKIEIPVEEALKAAKNYLVVEITSIRGGRPAPRAAQFHIRRSGGDAKIAGIVH